jgi:uncharacterized protein (TIGR02452 family)
MANRNNRSEIAAETVQICALGSYLGASARTVSVADELKRSIAGTRLFSPGDLAKLAEAVPPPRGATRFRVGNFTTLSAAKQLHDAYGSERTALLNFASAKNPGGGFLSGAQAQEESLARASGLYASLQCMPEYYDLNRRCKSVVYTDHMIYSPQVPVFRD